MTMAMAGTRPAAPAGEVGLGAARVRFTARADGDLAAATGPDPKLEARRRAVLDRPWTWLRQIHGAGVVTVTRPGDRAGAVADGAVSATTGVALAVMTADCAPVALASREGIIGVAHAGWRGLVAGVIHETAAMRALGATEVIAALGPCIHAECYAFSADDIDVIEAGLGDAVRSVTRHGGPALDLPAAVRAGLRAADADLVVDAGLCTACSADHWSWRAGRPTERQATVVWLP